ncbi:MAG: bifunctional (p)ppGpp synthetase/guanosine-3',5'-bis(diphosphate) 3'-pyrophosphohydrolase [Marinicaulis sp.]|nr:bifunctional (p)ppGpp synthetase/guanosine-3',5'-bis(diphosphate) 3'-pyrophosphohydrolase [Marinicaulis sp.]
MAKKSTADGTSEAPIAQESRSTDKTQFAAADVGAANSVADRSAQAATGGSASAGETQAEAANSLSFIGKAQLVDLVKAYDPNADEKLLGKAYDFAQEAHKPQIRQSGEPYFTHPLAVATILTELRTDPATVATALLHDVVEDCDVPIEKIQKEFGKDVAQLVNGVTKLTQIELSDEATKQAENFRKLVVAMADDVRVLLVKLADRLHNMRTLHHLNNPEKRQRIALETMEIYAPLAGRIGVQRFREELEDIAFRELSPDAHATIQVRLEGLQKNTVGGVVELASVLREKLAEVGIKALVYSREKRAYSIWRKMQHKNVSFDDLADIYAFRVLVDDIPACYAALGVIHSNWRMIPVEFDDYISAPKPNHYRSIHTAVIGPPDKEGRRQRIEIQIRTFEMHETAERGVAAHWQYKDRIFRRPGKVEINTKGGFDPYETPRRLVEMFQTGDDPNEALQYAKLELFQDQVFCFTPKGRVIALPKGSTALDFAYALHTDVGDQCIGANINGSQRPLRTPLGMGDVVEILKSENAPVPAEWESIAVTGRARSAIRRRIKKMQHDEHVALGRSIAESIFTGAHLQFSVKGVRASLKRLGKKSVEDVLVAVGRGELPVNDLIEAVYPGASVSTDGEIRPASLQAFVPRVAISGLTPGVSVKMSRCCSPLPGERIVGIRNDDGGVAVHTIYCDTLATDEPEESRWLDLKWREGQEDNITAFARITVTVQNGVGVLSEVAGIVARYGVSIASIRLQNRSKEFLEMVMDVEVHDAKQLSQTLAGIRAAPTVLSAERTGSVDDEQL